MDLFLHYVPEIPPWPQLPTYRNEGMLIQFCQDYQGRTVTADKAFVNVSAADFGNRMLSFYEDYAAVADGRKALNDSLFALNKDDAPGFFRLLEVLDASGQKPAAVKGQITGPITLTTGIGDENGKAIFYNADIRDMAVKLLALKAAWQVETLSRFGCPVILFFDERP